MHIKTWHKIDQQFTVLVTAFTRQTAQRIVGLYLSKVPEERLWSRCKWIFVLNGKLVRLVVHMRYVVGQGQRRRQPLRGVMACNNQCHHSACSNHSDKRGPAKSVPLPIFVSSSHPPWTTTRMGLEEIRPRSLRLSCHIPLHPSYPS